MKWKTVFAAACAAAFAVPAALAQETTGGGIPSGRVISVNIKGVGNDNNPFPDSLVGDTSAFSGLVPVVNANWNEVETPTGNGVTTEIANAKDSTGEKTTARINLAVGGGWTLKAKSTAVQNAREARIGKMGLGYADACKTDRTSEITLANVPYTEYSVILYYATDNENKKWAPAKVKTSGDTETYYYYGEDDTLKNDGSSTSTWGSSSDCASSADNTATLGKDIMRIDGLSGDLSIDLDTTSADTFGGLCGFQIVEVLPSISVNFAGDASGTHSEPIPKTSDSYGLFPVPGSEWKNGFTGSGAIQVSSAYGSSETFSSTLFYKSKNIWHNTDSYDTLLQTYLDDGNNGASISMEKVPFTEYAVIVYCAAGNGQPFLPVTVNNKTYTWSDTDNATVEGSANFGSSSVTTPTLGENALCVTGLTGALTVQGRSGGENGARGGIAAIQIICTGKVDASLAPAPEAETSVISLNFGSNHGSVPQTADTYGLIPVPGYTWTNISRASGSQTVTVASGKPLTKEPTVAYDSDLTYYYNPATDPFLKGYLDDGQRSEGVGASVTVSGLPFWAYDVVVYAGLDTSATVALPVRINDTLYTWDRARGATIATNNKTAVYGEGAQATAEYGKNALRVKGLLRNDCGLTVQGLPRINQNSQRGGIAAIQIVERKVIDQSNFGDLDPDSDTPVHILLTAQISGDLTLPPDAILDLSSYWLFGATPPITGTLTVNKGTQIRLPKGASWTIAGTIEGADSLADNAVIVGGSLATGVEVNAADGTISADATYVWTGDFDNLWSNQYNWSSYTVPNAEADVTIPLDANGAVRIELPADTDAVAKSVTITGPESGSATLALTSAEGATGSLTVFGQMLTTGNVTVTQSADITVQGASTMGDGSPIPQNQVVQASFQVNGSAAGYTVASGTLSVQVPAGGGDVSVSNGGTLTVGEGGTLSASRAIATYYDKSTVSTTTSGTLSIAGRATFSTQLSLSSSGFSVELAGGILETPYVNSSSQGLNVSAASIFVGSWPTELNAKGIRGSTKTFTGEGNLTLQGEVCFKYEVLGATGLVSGDSVITADYTGELIADANSSVSLGENRPKLKVRENAKVTVTPTPDEAESGTIVFSTSMTTEPENVTYTVYVNGVEKTPSVTVNGGKLTLSWEADYPTLATSGYWSTGTWKTSAGSTGAPSEGSAILDGTKEAITVTLDTDLSNMTSIFVKGNVTLVTKGTQSTTIPACVKLTEEGTTLTVDADFSGAWELPAGTTLQVTQGFTSFAGLTLEGEVVILEDASGTDASPTEIEAPSPVEFNGGLTIAASNLTLKSMYNVGTTLALVGNNITIAGNRFFTDTGTEVVNTGTSNAITGMTGLNGSLAVQRGTLALTLGAEPNKTYFSGATIAEDATLTLAAEPDSSTGVTTAQGWFFPVTGDGTLEIEVGYDFRPMFSAVSQEATTLPKHLVFTATAEEQVAGVIECKAESGLTLPPEGFTVTVNPAEGYGAWAPKAVLEAGYLRIYNQLPTNLPAGVADSVAEAIQQAAQNAGIENKGYTVQLTTKGGRTTIASPDAATLNDVLGCFTGLTATASADKTTLTYAYEFGISGVRRTAEGGWEVVVKVTTGAEGATAGFAAENVYTVNGATVASSDVSQTEAGEVVLSVTEEQLKDGVSVSVARP